jgi:hemolysin III
VSTRVQSLGEEIANSVSHGIGFLAALTVTPFLVMTAIPHGTASIVGVSVFAFSMAVLYITSTLYHALPGTRTKRVFRVLDHGAIFLLIAGSYTPFTLGILQGAGGWTLFGVIWGLAAAGMIFTAVAKFRFPIISAIIYVAMGWLVVIAIRPLLQRMPPAGLLWLLAGGLAYTGGLAFYAARKLRYGHFLWHLCVLTGTACHCVAIMKYAA